MPVSDTRSIVDWLADGARSAPRPEMVLEQLCDRLVQIGVPLWRVAVLVRTLHPEIMGRRFIWQPGAAVEISEGTFDVLDSDQFRRSPFAAVVEAGRPLRYPLTGASESDEFSIFPELRGEGATDY